MENLTTNEILTYIGIGIYLAMSLEAYVSGAMDSRTRLKVTLKNIMFPAYYLGRYLTRVLEADLVDVFKKLRK